MDGWMVHYACAGVYLCVCLYTRMHACMYVCLFVCMVCMHGMYACMHDRLSGWVEPTNWVAQSFLPEASERLLSIVTDSQRF
jgi:hypothetical protein